MRGIISYLVRFAFGGEWKKRSLRTAAHNAAIGPEQPRKTEIAVPRELEMAVPNGSEISKRRTGRCRADGLGRCKSDDLSCLSAGLVEISTEP